MINIGESTLLISSGFEEEWEVIVDGKKFTLDENQIAVVKKASSENNRGIIWFKDIAISVAHISSAELVYEGAKRESKKYRYEEVLDKDGKIASYRMVEE